MQQSNVNEIWREEAIQAVPLAIKAILAVLNDAACSPALRLRAAGMILKVANCAVPQKTEKLHKSAQSAASVEERKLEIVHNPAQRDPILPRPFQES